MHRSAAVAILLALLAASPLFSQEPSADGFVALFPDESALENWTVRRWDDISEPVDENVRWTLKDGVLHGCEPRGAWLVSNDEYGDFILEFEWKLGDRGNSGCGLRFPPDGDPAFDGLELQMVDPRYFGDAAAKPSELSGALYRAVEPSEQLFKPNDWNKYRIECIQERVRVTLNGKQIVDINLDEQTTPTSRHDGSEAPPLKDRPRKGRIGFQELSRGGDHVQIREARIKVMSPN
jgi:hypothetical protein